MIVLAYAGTVVPSHIILAFLSMPFWLEDRGYVVLKKTYLAMHGEYKECANPSSPRGQTPLCLFRR